MGIAKFVGIVTIQSQEFHSDSYDLVKDWGKIKPLTIFDSKCSDCGIAIQLPFKPDGKRPVYCKDCLPKHRK